jgi:hypothetical protein
MKFSIRDVLFVTVIVALIIGWWIDRTRLARQSPAPPAASGGPYELIFNDNETLLFDARTGELWRRYSDGHWIVHASSLAESQKH